jgi:hypothetical protein
MEKPMHMTLKVLAITLAVLTLACGGGGGGGNQTINYKRAYTDPVSNSPSVPVICLNTSLSTDQVAVFDVIASSPTLQVRGVALNLIVDLTKVSFVDVPGGNEGASLGSISTVGLGGTNGRAVAKLDNQGCNRMGTAIRLPGTAQPANGVMMRFALQLLGQPVEGVIQATVGQGSGLLDPTGEIIPGTSPILGRLEMVKD